MSKVFHRAQRGALSSRLLKPCSAFSLSYRRFSWTGDRYKGYVSYFNNDQLFGFAVRDDLPEREYYFHATDLMCDSIPRVRPLQPLSFTIHEGRGNNQFLARDLAAPDGSSLVFNHPNLRLRAEERTRRLSELPEFDTERHSGVVVANHTDGKGGLIVPNRLNYDVVSFRNFEIQCTGGERLDKFSEVEFFIRRGNRRDLAMCITRVNGQLITAERRETGQIRRALGAMYTPKDLNARVPEEFKHERKRGYVQMFQSEKLFGWIVPEDMSTTAGDSQSSAEGMVFVHADDCHMCGKRSLRRFQPVEYCLARDSETGKSKAMHVTGYNQTVLRYVSDNHYVPGELCTKELETCDDGSVRHLGEVVSAPRGRQFAIVKPVKQGFAAVFVPNSSIRRLGRAALNVGDVVEFSCVRREVDEEESEESSSIQRNLLGTDVTMADKKPFVFETREFGGYLRERRHIPFDVNSLPQAEASAGTKYSGFVASFSPRLRRGLIEVRAPDGERFRKVKFELADSNADTSSLSAQRPEDEMPQVGDFVIHVNSGESIEFELDECEPDRDGDVITRKAVKITGVEGSLVPSRTFQIEEREENTGGFQQRTEPQRSSILESKNPLESKKPVVEEENEEEMWKDL